MSVQYQLTVEKKRNLSLVGGFMLSLNGRHIKDDTMLTALLFLLFSSTSNKKTANLALLSVVIATEI